MDLERDRLAVEAHLERLEVDLGLPGGHQRLDLVLGQHDREQPDLRAVVEEDVRERGGDDRLEAVVLERPGGVLSARPAAEVRAGGEDRVGRQVPAVLLLPVIEEELAEAGALDPLQELLGDDLVGVDIRAVEHGHLAFDDADGLHHSHSLMSTKCPSMAAAAAISGETRWVRPPRPWRPSKLRFEVEAQRSPGWRMSGFMPRHIEQPAVRQSKPAARKTSWRPSCSACRRTCWEPGTTIASTFEATLRPLTSWAGARRSPIREFVHEPMKTRSSLSSEIGVPARRPMYCSERSSVSDLGSGTAAATPTTWPGFAPHVTSGVSALVSTVISP